MVVEMFLGLHYQTDILDNRAFKELVATKYQ